MNILKKEYAACWETHIYFKIVDLDCEEIARVKGIENACIFLATCLNCDCKISGRLIDDFTLNYLIVDEDKDVYTIDFKHKGEEVAIYLENAAGELVVCFDMSEYIEADERYY